MNGWEVTILEMASNTYWVIGIFIFFTLLLHFLFVFYFPLSLRAWKLADYLWLTLAFLSTLGLVGEAKQFRAQNSHYESEWQASQSLNDVRGWYINYQIYICSEADALKSKALKETDYHKLCEWLEIRINELNLLQKGSVDFPDLPPSLTEGLDHYSTIIPPLEQAILKHRIAKYTEKRIMNMENIKDSKKSTLQMIILIIAPMMLAFALAIRFTKVTAEFKLLPPTKKKT